MPFEYFHLFRFSSHYKNYALPVIISSESYTDIERLSVHLSNSLNENYSKVAIDLRIPLVAEYKDFIDQKLKECFDFRSAVIHLRKWYFPHIPVLSYELVGHYQNLSGRLDLSSGETAYSFACEDLKIGITSARHRYEDFEEPLILDIVELDPIQVLLGFEESDILQEHQMYKAVPRTNFLVRFDRGNTFTKTQTHAHVYLNKKEILAINMDGTGHDGSSGMMIPTRVADFLRGRGYKIPSDNILEQTEIQLNQKYLVYTIGSANIRQTGLFGPEI